jgi:hypothetical protein
MTITRPAAGHRVAAAALEAGIGWAKTGSRELGPRGIEEHLQYKAVYANVD